MSELALLGGKPVRTSPIPAYYTIGDEEKNAVNSIFDEKLLLSDFLGRAGAKFLGGKYVQELESLFNSYFGVKHSVTFNSATSALQAAIVAIGVGPGDEIICPPFTMSATPTSVLFNNAIPVFADIDETFCLDPDSVEKNISEKTKAIYVVNLMGRTPNFEKILELAKKHGLKIIEDSAQAMGATYKGKFAGTIGDIGVFSFNIHKVVQCGEGGVLVCNDDKMALRAQLYRNHGEVVMDDMVDAGAEFEALIGGNFRMSELHAAVAIEQFKKLDKLNAERIKLADYLSEKLSRFEWLNHPSNAENSKHVYYIYGFRFFSEKIGIKRKTFALAMAAEGYKLNEGYQKPLYLLPIYQEKRIFPNSQFPFVSSEFPSNVSYQKGICSFTEKMYFEELLFTAICQPPQSFSDIDDFTSAIEKIEKNVSELKEYESKN